MPAAHLEHQLLTYGPGQRFVSQDNWRSSYQPLKIRTARDEGSTTSSLATPGFHEALTAHPVLKTYWEPAPNSKCM